MMLKMPAPLDTAPQTIELGTELACQSLNRDATRPLLLTRDLCTADPSRPRRQNDQAPSRDEQPVDAIAMLTVEHWLINDLFTQEARAGDVSPKPMIAEQVFTALEVHAQREENVFYPAYETMTGKNGPQLVADSRLAHEQGKALLIELQGPDLDEEACEATGQKLMHTVEQHGLKDNRLRVFRSANTAHLGHRGDQEGQPRVVPSEKYMECA
jgi:hypothetical protein